MENQRFDTQGYILYSLRNAEVKPWPFPHFYAENVFPARFYKNFTQKLAEKTDFKAAEGRYEGRTFANTDDFPELGFMQTKDFLREVAQIFAPWLKLRYPNKKAVLYNDLRLIRDGLGYSIGPHTDACWKVASLLFYLPTDHKNRQCGTSLYLPKDREFRCTGGPHHDPEHFDLIHTAEYKPNTCLGFFKTDQSFHGVEPVPVQFNRDALLFNIYCQEMYDKFHKSTGEQGDGTTS